MDDQPARVEVDVLPAQRDQLAEAQAGVRGQAEELTVLGRRDLLFGGCLLSWRSDVHAYGKAR